MLDNTQRAQQQYWRNLERRRPTNIVVPARGQESVWAYPRPPAVEAFAMRLQVWFAGVPIADTTRGLRVIETSCAPTYYFPQEDVRMDFLKPMIHTTICEWKGLASYWNVTIRGRRQEAIAWSYNSPEPGYDRIKLHLAFYPRLVDTCLVGTERVQPQDDDYYGGWLTSNIVGPFKGAPGSQRW
jgi:uncharacterized protein (DUF427 family)